MKYTIIENTEHNSLEVTFDAKPDAQTRDALKALRFRWHRKRGLWYGYTDRETLEKALSGAPVSEPQAGSKPAAPKPDLDMIRTEYAKVWSGKMLDYCMKKVAAAAILPTGEIIPVDKQKIETRFCFGESGYDYDDAAQAAEHARTSAEYFMRENLKEFTSWIEGLEAARTMDSGTVLTIIPKPYMNQTDACRIAGIRFQRLADVLDACGGSAYLEELPGKVLTIRGMEYRIATDEEINLILAAYRQAAAQHEKKVAAYLKRYGTSKVHAWTYWRDA